MSTKRWTATSKTETETVKPKRTYGAVSPKDIYEICLKERRIPTYEEIQKILKQEGTYVNTKTIQRAVAKLKSGAPVDGMGNIQTLKSAIETHKETKGDVMKEATEQIFHAKEFELHQSESYISSIRRTLNRVATVLEKPDPRTWTRGEVMEEIFDPMLNDLDPFNPTAPKSEWSVLTITAEAVNIRRVAPQLNKPVEQGGLQGSYKRWNTIWSQTHDGRQWQPPRTWLRRKDYAEFHEALKTANPQHLPQLGIWTLGELMQLAFDTQIVTGMRERYETLMLPFERINLPNGATTLQNIGDKITYVSAKKAETWEDLPLRLFSDLCYRRLIEWFNYCKSIGKKPTDRIFPITYEVYRNAIVKARKICKFEGHEKITGHAARRTHGTWLRIGGASVEQICGQEPKGFLGVGWRTKETFMGHYLSFELETIEAMVRASIQFNPLGTLSAEQEKLASRYETGRLTTEGEKED